MFKRGRVPNNVHLLWGFLSFAAALLILLYLLFFVVIPSRQIMGAKQEQCIIRKAKLSCWRKKALSAAEIEQGRHKCWLFTVKVGNVSQEVQHNTLKDFPLEHDGCSSASTCGMEVWPCRLSKDQSIRLRWSYPINKTVYCSLGIVVSLLCGGIAVMKYFRLGKDEDEEQDHCRHDSSIPFSSFNEDEINECETDEKIDTQSLACLV
ncbi:unnamed protein product [Agarophyton chilense]